MKTIKLTTVDSENRQGYAVIIAVERIVSIEARIWHSFRRPLGSVITTEYGVFKVYESVDEVELMMKNASEK